MQLTVWTEAVCADFLDLVKGGEDLSARQIASALSTKHQVNISRNAVVGRAFRTGVNLPRESSRIIGHRRMLARGQQPKIPRARRRSGYISADLQCLFGVRQPPKLELPEWSGDETAETTIPIGQRRTLMELNSATCRWPVGDPRTPDFFYCGARAIDDHPYCPPHHREAHQRKARS